MSKKKTPQDPDALLASLLAEADPAILARFTGQSRVESAETALDRLGAGEVVTLEPSLDVGELDIIEVSDASVEPSPAPPVSEDAEQAAVNDAEQSPPATQPERIRADGLPVAVVDLWGDLDESSPPQGAPPTLEEEPEKD